MNKLNKLFNFVLLCSKEYPIDESHGLSHSMNVLNFAHDIYNSEINNNKWLKQHEEIIYTSAILHDMCDNKYINVDTGLNNINNILEENNFDNIEIINKIITTMSYSTVKKNGFPDLQNYQLAYHIVREADLLSAYDFDRCMNYNIHKQNGNINSAFIDAQNLFEKRMFKHNQDNLFITQYSKMKSYELENIALKRINNWKNLLK
jgi:hypothetical protein